MYFGDFAFRIRVRFGKRRDEMRDILVRIKQTQLNCHRLENWCNDDNSYPTLTLTPTKKKKIRLRLKSRTSSRRWVGVESHKQDRHLNSTPTLRQLITFLFILVVAPHAYARGTPKWCICDTRIRLSMLNMKLLL